MTKNDIQENRMRSYFIEAAKSLIKGEGIRVFSVRNVAERAGYSYATLYGYFRDIKDLLYYCILDFIDECRQCVIAQSAGANPGSERIMASSKAFANYFVQYPGIFDLLFLDKVYMVAGQERIIETINKFLAEIFEGDWAVCGQSRGMKPKEIDLLKERHVLIISSLLMFYIGRRHPKDYSEFLDKLVSQIGSL